MSAVRIAPIFDRRPYSEEVLERMAMDALRNTGELLPRRPAAIAIERLIETEFGFNETYEPLDDGVLGEIHFGIEDRPLGIRIARRLGEIRPGDHALEHERRLTLAHECGHGLAHSKLFARSLRREQAPRLPGFDTGQSHIACRDRDICANADRPQSITNDEIWLEWEANFLMAALLLPRRLVLDGVAEWLTGESNGVAPRQLPEIHRQVAVAATAHTFNVSENLAASRLASILPQNQHPDLFETAGVVFPLSHGNLRPPTRLRSQSIRHRVETAKQ